MRFLRPEHDDTHVRAFPRSGSHLATRRRSAGDAAGSRRECDALGIGRRRRRSPRPVRRDPPPGLHARPGRPARQADVAHAVGGRRLCVEFGRHDQSRATDLRSAREVGALSFLDAVHYAPHALVDVGEFGCDFLACSAYKFFGPHVGVLWGRRELLESLPAYKVRPAPNDLPGKWMTGTQNHEGIAGTLAAVEYLAELGRELAEDRGLDRRTALRRAFAAIGDYERGLISRLIAGLSGVEAVSVRGITDPSRMAERLPTISLTHARRSPPEVAMALGTQGIFVWHGNYYALQLTEALGLEPGGMVRIGLVHYNTASEVDQLIEALANLS